MRRWEHACSLTVIRHTERLKSADLSRRGSVTSRIRGGGSSYRIARTGFRVLASNSESSACDTRFRAGIKMDRKESDVYLRLDRTRLPQHIAIIMDGNGRWARRRHMPRVAGHRAGVASVRSTVETAARIGIPALTLYAFSEENWKKRPQDRSRFPHAPAVPLSQSGNQDAQRK